LYLLDFNALLRFYGELGVGVIETIEDLSARVAFDIRIIIVV